MRWLVLAACAACGGPVSRPLSGELTVDLQLVGDWAGPAVVHAHVAAFIEGLPAAGYFDGAPARPVFTVIPALGSASPARSGGLLVVEIHAPSIADAGAACGWHLRSGGDYLIQISSRCSAWDDMSFILAHEIIETVAGSEVADECEGADDARDLVVAGESVKVAAYRATDGSCFPHQ